MLNVDNTRKSGVANLISENDPKNVKNYEVMDKK